MSDPVSDDSILEAMDFPMSSEFYLILSDDFGWTPVGTDHESIETLTKTQNFSCPEILVL